MSEQEQAKAPAWLGAARLLIGLAQGLALFCLHRTDDLGYWPATNPELFGALALVVVFVPLIGIGGLGALRPATLSIWMVIAALVLGWMGWHDLARGMRPSFRDDSWPDSTTFMAAAAIVFVAHHLIAAGDEARKWIAPYERYFDLGWRHAAQLVLSCAFTGAFWLLLYLGAALFKIINITFLDELIRKDWFYFPASTVAFATAIHLTDLRSGLVRGVRALSLMLLSWLMPVMTVLGAAFLLALPFTGLDPLWKTRAAGAILLSAAANLIILINAAYQDGGADTSRSVVLRIGARLAAVLLAPFIVLATVALYLRVNQYGWSPERIEAAALIVVGACYAGFYLIAAFWRPWIKLIESANIATACVGIAILIAIFTPIFDPARIAVANQMQRLQAGTVTPAEFDYIFLQFDAGRYGQAAAARLRADHSTDRARELAARMTAIGQYRDRWRAEQATRPQPADEAELPRVTDRRAPLRFTLMQGSPPLPADFVAHANELYGGPLWSCREGRSPCEARAINVDSDPALEVLVASGTLIGIFDVGPRGWQIVGRGSLCSPEDRDALRAGQVETAAPQYNELFVRGRHVQLESGWSDNCFTESTSEQ